MAERQPVFYYDLGSPESYLVAERIGTALPVVAEWEPVSATDLGSTEDQPDRALIERLAAERGMLTLRWPARWPPNTRNAMLAATYAKQIGRTVAFSLAAFRQAFAGGRDLSELDTVLIAAAACEMHPTAVIKGLELRSVADALEQAAVRGRAAGVRRVPAIAFESQVLYGDAGLEQAAGALR